MPGAGRPASLTRISFIVLRRGETALSLQAPAGERASIFLINFIWNRIEKGLSNQ
jgi:hypothetical protein